MAKKNYVSFDADTLRSCAKLYSDYADELDNIKKDLLKAMEDLVTTYWIGKASTKFKSIIGDDWIDTVTRYCELMHDLTIIMNDVVSTYEGFLDEAKQLKIS